MSDFEEQTALLEEYEKWKGEKKVAANDLSPSAFLVDRAQKAAYAQLEETLRELAFERNKLSLILAELSEPVAEDFEDHGMTQRLTTYASAEYQKLEEW